MFELELDCYFVLDCTEDSKDSSHGTFLLIPKMEVPYMENTVVLHRDDCCSNSLGTFPVENNQKIRKKSKEMGIDQRVVVVDDDEPKQRKKKSLETEEKEPLILLLLVT